MKTRIHALLLAALLATFASPAAAATISISTPGVVSGPTFDVVVSATNVFTGRALDDFLVSFGFNVTVSDPTKVSFTGATAGPEFEAATTQPGTNVFAAASNFGIATPVAEPLILATLHFATLASGTTNINITTDLANVFQGLQFINAPFMESIGGTVPVTVATQTAVPEPTTLVLSGLGLIGVAVRRRLARS